MNEVVKWPAGNFIEIELDNIYPAESIDINFGKKEPCTWGRFEISADGKEWKTIDLKQKDARLTAGLQKAPVKSFDLQMRVVMNNKYIYANLCCR